MSKKTKLKFNLRVLMALKGIKYDRYVNITK